MLVAAVAAAAVLAGAPTGCSATCTDTSIEAMPATTGEDGALVLRARMTSDGDPVEGAQLTFYSETEGGQGSGGHTIGEARTDADGVATLVRDEGMEGMAVLDAEVVGYEVRYAKLDKVDDVSYCTASADGTIDGA